MARLKAPVGMSSFSHAGNVYEIGKDGHVEVPSHIICEQVLSHGLTVAPDSPPKAAPTNGADEDSALEETKHTASAGEPLISEEHHKTTKPSLKK